MTTPTTLDRATVERNQRVPVVPPGSPTLPGEPGTKPPAAGVHARPAAGTKPPIRTAARGAVRAGTIQGAAHGTAPRRLGPAAPADSQGPAPAGGTRPGRYRADNRPHGTRARYLSGPDEHGKPNACRCEACKEANRVYGARRERLIAYGQWQPPFTDAEPVRAHIRMLSGYGIGWRRVAALTGISPNVISILTWGRPGRPLCKKVRATTASKILAIRATVDNLADKALIDGTGTRRRLQALITVGWSQARLAARFGWSPQNFCQLVTQDQVTAATARAVRGLYDELWNEIPPAENHREKISVNRARNYARARGWAPPQAWDDDAIDDPAAVPEGHQRPKRLGTVELAAEGRELLCEGFTVQQAAERLGVSRSALQKALDRTRKEAA